MHVPLGRTGPRVLKLGPIPARHSVLLGRAKYDTRHERTCLSRVGPYRNFLSSNQPFFHLYTIAHFFTPSCVHVPYHTSIRTTPTESCYDSSHVPRPPPRCSPHE
ncbi:hypothetical protein TorRG33x02_186470 [Trema orientale]|uniref:Uncharacterized protein n=1 Tax=Trema orientale TaxID=63057 RepID=A0A2P5EIY0_TREOI|nr:hypothetical protein TorRG33x02_186470 [Trema orientale]